MRTETKRNPVRICPECGNRYEGHPAISRTDNRTRICPDCGTRQAMAAMGVGPEEREEIVRIIRRACAGREAVRNGG